jgi:enterochelin esterase-like enzyme
MQNKIIDLKGQWHFKLYRMYSDMFQFLDAQKGSVSKTHVIWEDVRVAKVPAEKEFCEWETFMTPDHNYATGGLLMLSREDQNPRSTEEGTGDARLRDPGRALFPKWSEAWFCRTFNVQPGFAEEDVFLLMGILDDIDVIYVNGSPVAASGFINGNGEKVIPDLPFGGFDYEAGEPEKQVRFERSYWEDEREYRIPSSAIHEGKNEICVRLYNNNGNGGFYEGHAYAICADVPSVRKSTGLPFEPVVNAELQAVVRQQISALEKGNINDYGNTVWSFYHDDGENKEEYLRTLGALAGQKKSVLVRDQNAGFYRDGETAYVYAADRRVSDRETGQALFSGHIEQTFREKDGRLLECGNQNRCYSTVYCSKLLGIDQMSYSVYLPPDYYQNPEKRYPVVYLLHGIHSSSSSFVKVDRIGSFMDKEIFAGKIRGMIVIMPDSGKESFYRDTEGAVSDMSGPWETHIFREMVEMADQTYRTIPNADCRGISGISMGGYGAIRIGLAHPDVFSSIASHMGYIPPEEVLVSLEQMQKEQLDHYDFYLDCGKQDAMVNPDWTVQVAERLQKRGAHVICELSEGEHNSAFYMAGMGASMKMHSDHFDKQGMR